MLHEYAVIKLNRMGELLRLKRKQCRTTVWYTGWTLPYIFACFQFKSLLDWINIGIWAYTGFVPGVGGAKTKKMWSRGGPKPNNCDLPI